MCVCVCALICVFIAAWMLPAGMLFHTRGSFNMSEEFTDVRFDYISQECYKARFRKSLFFFFLPCGLVYIVL